MATMNGLTIRCPQSSMVYREHYVETTEEALLGVKWWEAVAEANGFELCPGGCESDCRRGCAEFIHETQGIMLETAVYDTDVTPGWTVTGWETHPHKDALGLVAVYFDGDCQCNSKEPKKLILRSTGKLVTGYGEDKGAPGYACQCVCCTPGNDCRCAAMIGQRQTRYMVQMRLVPRRLTQQHQTETSEGR